MSCNCVETAMQDLVKARPELTGCKVKHSAAKTHNGVTRPVAVIILKCAEEDIWHPATFCPFCGVAYDEGDQNE